MAIQYMDGLQIYGSVTARILETGVWVGYDLSGTNSGLIIDPTGETTDYVLRILGDGESSFRAVLPVARQGVGVAQRIHLTLLPVNNDLRYVFAEMRSAANELIYSWVVSPSGRIQLIQGKPDAYVNRVTVAETVGPVIGAGVWTHLEVFNDATTGAYELRIEGLVVLEGIDPDLSPLPATEIAQVAWSGVWQYNFDPAIDARMSIQDLIIWDTIGTLNTDFIGPVTVYTLPVDGDISSGWTGSDPMVAQYTLIDELDPNDADYISAGDPPPAPAIFSFQDLPEDVVAVRALQTVVRRRKTDGGEGQMTVSLLSDMSRDDGVNRAVTVSFAYQWDVSQADPATTGLWTPAAVDAADIEIDRTV